MLLKKRKLHRRFRFVMNDENLCEVLLKLIDNDKYSNAQGFINSTLVAICKEKNVSAHQAFFYLVLYLL